jgi:hypothetical protein
MGFDFDGYVLRAPRVSSVNAETSAEPTTGVLRDVREVPGTYDLEVDAPAFVDAHADLYRASTLNQPFDSTTEYALWAANTSILTLVGGDAWLTSEGTGSIPEGSLEVVDLDPPPLPPDEPPPEGYGTETDGTDRVVVVDDGGRAIGVIAAIAVARGDVTDYQDEGWVDPDDPTLGRAGSNPYLVFPPLGDPLDQDADAGIVRLSAADLTVLDGGLSAARGDQIIEVRYSLAPQTFWWSRNDRYETRFQWSDERQRWEPRRGSSPRDLGRLDSTSSYRLSPVPTGFAVGSPLPSSGTPDAYSMIRVGSEPDAGSTPVTNVVVKFDEDLAGGFDWAKDPTANAVVGRTSGELQFNPEFVAANAGQTVWYSFRGFPEDETGVLGELRDAEDQEFFLAPIPGPTEHPFIRLGSRRHLSVLTADTDFDLSGTAVSEGEVGVSLSTGKLKFSAADKGKADINSAFFDKHYLTADIVYDGVALNRVPQPTRAPVPLVDFTGSPTPVDSDVILFVPDAVLLPDEFVTQDTHRGLGKSGVLDVTDGTGTLPAGIGQPASVRPGGDTVSATTTGRIRQVEDGLGDTILFSRYGALEQLEIVRFEDELPTLSFKIPEGTAHIAKERGVAGSQVAISSADRSRFDGDYLYFLQASLPLATFTTEARLFSRVRDIFVFDGTEELRFAVDTFAYTWPSSDLTLANPNRNAFTATEVAASIDSFITNTGSAYEFNGYVVISAANVDTGTVEIGFGIGGEKNITGASALGFGPGWRIKGGGPNWLPDTGTSFGLFRSPANLDRSTGVADYQARARIENEVMQEVQGIPLVFLDRAPLEDVAGIDEDVFFDLTATLNVGGEIVLVKKLLRHLEDILHDFGVRRFLWLESASISTLVGLPTDVLDLQRAGVVPETLLNAPDVGGGLYVAEGGGAFVFQVQDEDYLLPDDGQQGVAQLIERIGAEVLTGARGTFAAGGTTFIDTLGGLSEAQAGYRLKVLSGEAQGSYIVTQVFSDVVVYVTPPFPVDAPLSEPVSWEMFRGYTEDVYDPGLIADTQFKDFNHILDEPFVVVLLTSVGVLPEDAADQLDNRLRADMAQAVDRDRPVSIRFGLDHRADDLSNVGTLVALWKAELGGIRNDSLGVPIVPTDRFFTGAFSIQIGADKYEPAGVLSFSPDPATVEYLLQDDGDEPKGRLKFASSLLQDYAGSRVYYVQEFLSGNLVDEGLVEYDPDTGYLNFSTVDMTNRAGTVAYFTEAMITENKLDVSVSPLVGSFAFREPVSVGQVVEVTYNQADLTGAKTGAPIVEFLPVFIRDETATRYDSQSYRFNPDLRTPDERIEPIVFMGIFQLNFGTDDMTVRYEEDNTGIIDFRLPVPAEAIITISYSVFEALGGERAYESSSKPIYRPPFWIEANQSKFGLRGDRSGEFEVGQLIRLGGESFYLRFVTYFPEEDITSLGIFPSTTTEVGSRAPANDVLTVISDRPVALEIDPDGSSPLPVPDAAQGFFHTIPIETFPFEPITRNQTAITFLGNLTDLVAPGHLLEVQGSPFFVTDVALDQDGSRTALTLTSAFRDGVSIFDNPTIRVSARPVYPPNSRAFIGAGPFVETEDVELVRFGDLDEEGNELPGRTLSSPTEYTIDPGTGAISLIDPNTDPLEPGQRLSLSFTRTRTLTPVVQNGVLLVPRYTADFLYNTTPNEENGYLGATLTATYTFRNPDTFYARILPLRSFLGEVAQRAAREIATQTPAGGALLGLPPPDDNWEYGVIGLRSQRRDLTDYDRAARAFLSFYNTVIVDFEQILESMSGGIIGATSATHGTCGSERTTPSGSPPPTSS